MSKQEETRFKEAVLKDLRYIQHLWCFKSQEVGRRGIPDIIGCVNGTMFALELKTDTGDLDKLQRHTLQKIADAGGYAAVVFPSTWADVFTTLLALSSKPLKEIEIAGRG